MASFNGHFPPFGTDGSGDEWDDWDPDRARRGYTGHVPALRDLDVRPNAPIDLPTPVPRQQGGSGSGALSPAGLAASARVETADYLSVTYDQRDPGFAELYDAVIVPQWCMPFGRLLLSVFLTLARDPGCQVLDVACGTGYPTLELARYLGQDCDLAGIDTWEEAIQIARRKAAEEWLRNVTFLTADVLNSGLPERSFDVLTCNLALAHFADRAAALGAMWRLLRPQGNLLLTLPLQSAMREFLDTYYLTLRDLRLDNSLRQFSQFVSSQPTIDATRGLVERSGFEVRRAATDSVTLRFPSPAAFLRSPVVQTTYMPSWRSVVPDMTIRRLVFNEVERRLTARAEARGGELAMTVPMLCVYAVRI
ncbi:MAG TPA: class I SAM-dependent methyltransferase [Ktedonobacterales bacterium]|nr:class I SAM-dependent methyltransferase [Ktedonobacterales bacterium]